MAPSRPVEKRATSFTLSSELDEFIADQVGSGAFGSASEVVREAITRMRDEARKEERLYAALDRGLASPRAKPGVWKRVRKAVSTRDKR